MSKQICRTTLAVLAIAAGCAPSARGVDESRPAPLGATAASAYFLVADASPPRAASLVELLRRVGGLRAERRGDGGIALRLRGAGSALWVEPLVVLDGTPLPDGPVLGDFLAMIAPEDVVRVDVLKDPSATAIYGPRGAEGVVLITRRQPRR